LYGGDILPKNFCCSTYLREETLKAAVTALVNFQYHQPLAQHWGGGTLSSSDGQRFPVRGKVRNARALPRYFGYGEGITFYSWSSDQFSQYGTKVISSTIRDATYVLDEILNNETDLTIVEHTTDTAGFTVILTLVGYTRLLGRGERGRVCCPSPDEMPPPRLRSRRPLPTPLP